MDIDLNGEEIELERIRRERARIRAARRAIKVAGRSEHASWWAAGAVLPLGCLAFVVIAMCVAGVVVLL